MNNTAFFSGLAEESVNNVIVRNPDWRVPYRTCTNRCKALGHVDISSIRKYSPHVVQQCMEDCQSIIPTSRWECKDSICCRQHAQDNDTDFVKCMQDNKLPYDFRKDSGVTNKSTTLYPIGGQPSDEFVVMEGMTFLPEASLFSCRDTVSGQCVQNLSLSQCIAQCDKSPLCQLGYFIQLEPSGETFCLPLRQKEEFHHQKMTKYMIPVDQLELGETIRGTAFYRKSLDFASEIFVPTTFNPFVLQQNDRYVTQQLEMGGEDEALLFKFKNIQYKVNVIENNSLNFIVMYETLNSLVYNKQKQAFEFLQLVQVSQIERLHFDTDVYATTFQILNVNEDESFLRNKVQVKIALIDRLTTNNEKLGYVCIEDGKLSLQPLFNPQTGLFDIIFRELPPFQLPMDSVKQYYQKFWQQLPTEEGKHSSWWWVVIVCVAVVIVVVLMLWLWLSKR